MNLFQRLDATYQHLTARPRPAWLATIANGGLDDVVAAIRDDRPDTAASDTALRTLFDLSSEYPDALTVAMRALAPQLRARLSRSVTDDYRGDVLTDLALVHRLARVVDPDARLCSSHERTTASRVARKLEPLIASRLHAA